MFCLSVCVCEDVDVWLSGCLYDCTMSLCVSVSDWVYDSVCVSVFLTVSTSVSVWVVTERRRFCMLGDKLAYFHNVSQIIFIKAHTYTPP